MKKNYFAPKANIIEALCSEYCADALSSANINVDNNASENYVQGNVGDILGDEI